MATNLSTIAHEFGHLYEQIAFGRGDSEQFASDYALQKFIQFVKQPRGVAWINQTS